MSKQIIVVAAADLSVATLITSKRQQRRKSRAAVRRSSECRKAAWRPLMFGFVGVTNIVKSPRFRFLVGSVGFDYVVVTGHIPVHAGLFPLHGCGCCSCGVPIPFGQPL